jgi:hypothetical protein
MSIPESAVEAAERALVASNSPWPITDELWEKVKRTLGPNGTSSRREIELFLTAAGPVLCQPLQDEIDRLRAQIEAVEKLADEWSGGGAEQGRQHIMSCTAHPCPRCLLAEAAMDLRVTIGTHAHEWVKMPNVKVNVCVQCGVTAAAVPVGTGNPTQPRADR